MRLHTAINSDTWVATGFKNIYFRPGVSTTEGFRSREDYFDSRLQVLYHLGVRSRPVPKKRKSRSSGESVNDAGAVAQSRASKRHLWSAAEENTLVEGVLKHGHQWAQIAHDEELKFEHDRTCDDIEDKWLRMKKRKINVRARCPVLVGLADSTEAAGRTHRLRPRRPLQTGGSPTTQRSCWSRRLWRIC